MALSAGAVHLLDKAAPASHSPLVPAWGVGKAAVGMSFNGDGNGGLSPQSRQLYREGALHLRAPWSLLSH